MRYLLFVLLFVFDSVYAEFCLLDEPQPECEGYCYALVKPFLSYIPSLQKQLEATETVTLSMGQNGLNKINVQSTEQLKLTEVWQKRQDENEQNLLATQSKLKDTEELLEKSQNGRKNFTTIGDKYYYIENDETQTWLGALQKCAQWGGHLASLQSEEEWKNITNELTRGKRYWIDINDIYTAGVYLSATTGGQANYIKWLKGSPSNSNRIEHCVELGYLNYFEMNDCNCDFETNFICESNTE